MRRRMRWRRRVWRVSRLDHGLGLGLGWRAPLAALALRRPDLGFVEILAEAFPADAPLPLPLVEAGRRGVAIVPHGIGLGLGGAERPDDRRLRHLGRLAARVAAPLVSEHIAFVRAGGREAGHLLPVPRTRAALDVAVENVRVAMDALPVPLALEPIAAVFEWPGAEMDEATFVAELLERTGALLLLDVANLHANARNHGYDPADHLDRLPLDRIAYVHVAGGALLDGVYHDTHAHPVPSAVLDVLAALVARGAIPGAMLERDDRIPPTPAIEAELDAIAAACGGVWAALPAASRDSVPSSVHGTRALDRQRLAAEQAALVTSLHAAGPAPAGFDAGRIRVAAAALARKRASAGLESR
jgi:uncharacterized protein (UPF0276 family)